MINIRDIRSLFIDPFSLFALNKGLLTNNITFIISKSRFFTYKSHAHYIQTKNIHSPQDLDTIADWFILPCDFVIVEVLRHNKSNTI